MVPIWITNRDADRLYPVALQAVAQRMGTQETVQCNSKHFTTPEYIAVAKGIVVCGSGPDARVQEIIAAYKGAVVKELQAGGSLILITVNSDGEVAASRIAQEAPAQVITEELPEADVSGGLPLSPASDSPGIVAPVADAQEDLSATYDPKAPLREILGQIETEEDPAVLRAWLATEQANQARVTAIEAIQSQIVKRSAP